ncbi:unnamed protein product [Ambrosiozyma monospora]|nr:unnamed protein product [Ambrosiozyma monospora]
MGHPVVLESTNVTVSWKLKLQSITCFQFLLVVGFMDQTIGSIMHYMLDYYQVDRSQLSLLFLLQLLGYVTASFANEPLQKRLGLGNLTNFAMFCVMVTCLGFYWKFPLTLMFFFSICSGFGIGTVDCCLNVFVGNLKYANQLLGVMHAFYGLGCLVSPLLSIHLIELGWDWNQYYLLLFCFATTAFTCSVIMFRNETKWKYLYMIEHKHLKEQEADGDISQEPASTTELLRNKYILFFALTLFLYLGSELCAGIWFFNYLITIKKVVERSASYITSSYWASLTVGRFVLGFVTGHFFENNEVRAMVLYTGLISGGCAGFWMFENYTSLQVFFIDIVGFFVGPVFATSMVIAIKCFPARIGSGGIPVICGLGAAGGAVVPWVMGNIAEKLGDGTSGGGLVYFPNMMFTTFTGAFGLWFGFYLLNRKKLENYEKL